MRPSTSEVTSSTVPAPSRPPRRPRPPSCRARSRVGHERGVDRTGLPPRPDLLGHEGQERCEQAQLDREGGCQRRLGGGGTRVAGVAVGAGLDQLEVVVAERPEEGLGALERTGVVVPLEGGGGLVDHLRQAAEQRPVDRRGDRGDRSGIDRAVRAGEATEREP